MSVLHAQGGWILCPPVPPFPHPSRHNTSETQVDATRTPTNTTTGGGRLAPFTTCPWRRRRSPRRRSPSAWCGGGESECACGGVSGRSSVMRASTAGLASGDIARTRKKDGAPETLLCCFFSSWEPSVLAVWRRNELLPSAAPEPDPVAPRSVVSLSLPWSLSAGLGAHKIQVRGVCS